MSVYILTEKESYRTGDRIECVVEGCTFIGEVVVRPKDMTVSINVDGYDLITGCHLMYMAPWAYTKVLSNDSETNEIGTKRLRSLFVGLLDDCMNFLAVKDTLLLKKDEYLPHLEIYAREVKKIREQKSVAKKSFKAGDFSKKEYDVVCKIVREQVDEQKQLLVREFNRIFGDIVAEFKEASNICQVIEAICRNPEEKLLPVDIFKKHRCS